jgi:DNA-binding protein HU-beta
MNKAELVAAVAESTGMSKVDAEKAVVGVVDAVTASLVKGEKVGIPNLGTFEIRERAARDGRNPKTGEAIKIKASKAVGFKASKGLKEAVN